jgi:multidrug efflux pump subunit AcrB
VVELARIRMLRILITALATIVVLPPIVLVFDASTPLTRAAIEGLAASTATAVLLIRCTYEFLYSCSINEGVQ